MSVRSVRSIPQLRRALHSSGSAPNPSHLLSTQQSTIRSHYNSLTVQKLKFECKNRGLRQQGRKHELVDRIVGFEQAKTYSTKASSVQFSTTTPAEGPEKVDLFSVPQPPKSSSDNSHPVTKIPVKEGESGFAGIYNAEQYSSPKSSTVSGDIHVVDGSKSRVSAMHSDIGDGFNDASEPLSSKDKGFLAGLGAAIAAWFYLGSKTEKSIE